MGSGNDKRSAVEKLAEKLAEKNADAILEAYLQDASAAFTRMERDHDELVVKDIETFIKNDAGKPRASLVPPKTMHEVVVVFTDGAKKYDDDNWHKCPDKNRYYDAAWRHMQAWREGEDIDPDSGSPHLAHAIASLMMLRGLEIDVPVELETDNGK